MDIYFLLSFFGSSFFVFSYFLLNMNYIKADSLCYLLINLTAAVMMLVSLVDYFNIGALICNGLWTIITTQKIVSVRCKVKKQEIISGGLMEE